jgi:glutathione S-transferase
VIVMRAKRVEFEVTYINLRDKPDWFLKISPHGKVPVLQVDGEVLFESNAIAEFLDEVVAPRLHPADPIKRARNRAWTDFVPDFAKGLSGVYYTETREAVDAGLKEAPKVLAKLEEALAKERGNDGPYFNGDTLSLVDAAYAPFLQRFSMVDAHLGSRLLDGFPKVKAWTEALLATDMVTGSVHASFAQEFAGNLKRRGFWVSRLFEARAAE